MSLTRFCLALGYLYSAVSLSLINPENARGVLAAGCLLGGMDDLCGYSYNTCKRSLNVDTVVEWLKFVDFPPTSSDGLSPTDMHSTSVFGIYAQRLRDDIFNYLVVTLPNFLEVQSASTSESGSPHGMGGRDTLLRIFSLVPFDMFKTAVESPTFQIGRSLAVSKFPALELIFSQRYRRFRSSTFQVRKRRNRSQKECSRIRDGRRDCCSRFRRWKFWWERSAHHEKN